MFLLLAALKILNQPKDESVKKVTSRAIHMLICHKGCKCLKNVGAILIFHMTVNVTGKVLLNCNLNIGKAGSRKIMPKVGKK